MKCYIPATAPAKFGFDVLKGMLYHIHICIYMHTGADMRGPIKSLKVLSDETSIRVINLVLQRECCVCEVMHALVISQSKASRHLSALYDAGFLKLRKDGLWSLYSVNEEGLEDYQKDLVDSVRKIIKGDKLAESDSVRLRSVKRRVINNIDAVCVSEP
jgi:ArsR family transcriptional regulator